eukprot:EG_transcript_5189
MAPQAHPPSQFRRISIAFAGVFMALAALLLTHPMAAPAASWVHSHPVQRPYPAALAVPNAASAVPRGRQPVSGKPNSKEEGVPPPFPFLHATADYGQGPLWQRPQSWPQQLLGAVVQFPRQVAAFIANTFRSIYTYAQVRPIAFTILLVEFLVSVYFLNVAAHQIYLRLVSKGLIAVAAGAAASPRPVEVALSAFLHHIDVGLAQDVVLAPGRAQYLVDLAALKADGFTKGLPAVLTSALAPTEGTQRLFAYTLNSTPSLVEHMLAHGVAFRVAATQAWNQMLPRVFLVGYLGFVFWMFRRMFSDSGAKSVGKEARQTVRETFDDVAGLADAKASVMEVVNILRNPLQYKAMGARMPAGLLLVGPPGGGKTLLARCLAGEARVPFFACSGSDFVEVFAGRGASRVRALFAKAAAAAPCVVFIDELDALGKKRMMRVTSSNEDDQTLNQLLAAMDGFDTSNNGVVVVGATNRYNLLDDALIRPGRFDRIVRVELPSAPDREAILRVHLRGKTVDPTVWPQLRRLADLTPNFSGAALAALVNEAAIGAVRRNGNSIGFEDLELAVQQYRQSRGGSLFGDLF